MASSKPAQFMEAKPEEFAAAVFFADLVSSSGIKIRINERKYLPLLKRFKQIVADAIEAQAEYAVIEEPGDGLLMVFSTAASAVEVALRIQFATTYADWGATPLKVRIGVGFGTVSKIENLDRTVGVSGEVVDTASRLQNAARPNQILITPATEQDARRMLHEVLPPPPGMPGNGHALVWVCHGPYTIYQHPGPTEIFEVGIDGIAKTDRPRSSAKFKRFTVSKRPTPTPMPKPERGSTDAPDDDGGGVAVAAPPTHQYAIKLDRELDTFSKTEESHFLAAIKNLKRNGNVNLIGPLPGCVRFIVELTEEEAEVIEREIQAGALDQFGAQSITRLDAAQQADVRTEVEAGAKERSGLQIEQSSSDLARALHKNYRPRVRPRGPRVKEANVDRAVRLSRATMETLAVIAYRQPVTRAHLEAIRGVACGERLRSLMEMGLVTIAGRAEELGRPMLYGTTRQFLETFGLNSLKDLPTVYVPIAVTEPEVMPEPPEPQGVLEAVRQFVVGKIEREQQTRTISVATLRSLFSRRRVSDPRREVLIREILSWTGQQANQSEPRTPVIPGLLTILELAQVLEVSVDKILGRSESVTAAKASSESGIPRAIDERPAVPERAPEQRQW